MRNKKLLRVISIFMCVILCSCNKATTNDATSTTTVFNESQYMLTTALSNEEIHSTNKSVSDINADYNVVEQNSNNFAYSIMDEGFCIYGYNGMDNDVVIPEYIEGLQTISVNIPLISEKQIDSLTIPKTVTNITVNDSQEKDVKLYHVDNQNGQFISVNGVIYTNDGTKLIKYPCANDILEFKVPDSVTEIGACSFKYCENLKSVTIGENVDKIYEGAFSQADALENVIMKNGVEEIGWYAFLGCTSLHSIELPVSVKTIGNCAFNYCYNLSSITLHTGITKVGLGIFYENAITDIKIIEDGDGITLENDIICCGNAMVKMLLFRT